MSSRVARLILCIAAGAGLGLLASSFRAAALHLGNIDFDVFYQSGQAWLTGGDLYVANRAFPNLNPPQFAVAFSLFAMMPPIAALFVWQAMNAACVVAAAVMICRELKVPLSFTTVASGLAAAGLTTGLPLAFEEGQLIGVLTLCVTATWRAARHERWLEAGVLLGALVSLKPFFGCFLLIPLCRRRHWPFVAYTIVAAVMVLAAGLGFAGVASFRRWIEVGRQVTWFANPLNASLIGILSRANFGWGLWLPVASALGIVTLAVVSRRQDVDFDWLVCGALSLLVSPLGWVYYVPLLAGPLVAVSLERPWILMAGAGFLWPVLQLTALAPITRWSALTAFSLPFWSMLAVWSAAVVVRRRGTASLEALDGGSFLEALARPV